MRGLAKPTSRTSRCARVVLLVLFIPLPAAADMPDDIAALRERALAQVNDARRSAGLDALTLGNQTVKAAQAHADDMFRRRYYAHESPEGDMVQDRIIDAGGSRWQLVAENIARCADCDPPATEATVDELHDGWMNSPPHRRNILAPGLATFGFGMALDADQGIYAVQTFAGPGTPRGLGSDEEPIALGPEAQAGRALAAVNKARDRAGVPALDLDAGLRQAAENLLPPQKQDEFALPHGGDLSEALPEAERTTWAGVNVVAGACGGCGTEPTPADIRSFIHDWLGDPSYRPSLLDAQATHVGFAMRADGNGRKTAVLALGRRR